MEEPRKTARTRSGRARLARRSEQPIGSTLDKECSTGLSRKLIDRFNAAAVDLVHEVSPARVLDVGCGDGWLTSQVAARVRPASCVGVDQESARLRARWRSRKLDNLAFDVADVYQLPFDDGEFDVVTMFEVLEHCADVGAALRELIRVSSGWVVVSVPREPLWRMANVARGAYWPDWGNSPGHVNHWRTRTFAALVGRYGSVDVVVKRFPWTLVRIAANRDLASLLIGDKAARTAHELLGGRPAGRG